jgi:hypothetical protein
LSALTFGGTRDLPDERFFLFGMGLRAKFLYRAGALIRAPGAEPVHRWEIAEDIILPADYTVVLRTRAGARVRLNDDERGMWIEEASRRQALAGTDAAVKLPRFALNGSSGPCMFQAHRHVEKANGYQSDPAAPSTSPRISLPRQTVVSRLVIPAQA